MTTNTHSIMAESLLELVADPQRRTVLHHLRESGDGAVDVDELTEAITGDGGRETSVCGTDRTRTSVRLHHMHLPKLAEANIIDYDARTRTVRYHSNERVECLLQFVETNLV